MIQIADMDWVSSDAIKSVHLIRDMQSNGCAKKLLIACKDGGEFEVKGLWVGNVMQALDIRSKGSA